MADWVHCNQCFHHPTQQPKREYRLTSCGHIFCENCEIIGPIERCKCCKNPCSSIALSANINEDVKIYFEDEDEVIEKLSKIYTFHKSHRQKLFEHYRDVVHKYESIKVNYGKLHNHSKKLSEECKRTREENKQLREEMKNMRQEMTQNKNMLSHNIMTPPSNRPRKTLNPFFSKSSDASNNSFRLNSSFRSGVMSPTDSSLFVTPAQKKQPPQMYRNFNQLTPLSDMSDSPGSDAGAGYQSVPGKTVNLLYTVQQ